MEKQEFKAFERGGKGKGEAVLKEDIALKWVATILKEQYEDKNPEESYIYKEIEQNKIEYHIETLNMELLIYAIIIRDGGMAQFYREKGKLGTYPIDDVIRYIRFIKNK